MVGLYWLPDDPEWRAKLKHVDSGGPDTWAILLALSRSQMDFVRTNTLAATLAAHPAPAFSGKSVRLAIVSSCTCSQLHAAIRVAGLRREIDINIYESEFGQYWQELTDETSGLYRFQPSTILFALDAHHLAAGVNASMTAAQADAAFEEVQNRLREYWRVAQTLCSSVLQQTPLPVHSPLFGSNEHRLPGSKAAFIARLNAALRPMADHAGIDLVAADDYASREGLSVWHDPGLWHRAKQEVSPAMAPFYGDLVGRIIAARQGRAAKCLVLDLDNTIWGGVVGDDGLEGIILGQGSALGEAFAALQEYARELSRRGVILAVCSKNDEVNALEPFDKHPEMILRRSDIASFTANWSDKASNIRAIAAELNIGLDSLVFVDDNPFERALVRQELPMVAVPEVNDDPTEVPRILADAGYFEGLAITDDDRDRSQQYQSNVLRDELRTSATDLPSYLASLQMQLIWRRFDKLGLSRIVQLINKTNQFNLTTRRYTEADIAAVMHDPDAIGLQLRLKDRFGDNGIIAIIIGRKHDGDSLLIDTWLMSCRVLGRQVEQETLSLIVAAAKQLGLRRVLGEYVPTTKNGMVRDHYQKLNFVGTVTDPQGRSRAALDLDSFVPAQTFIEVKEG